MPITQATKEMLVWASDVEQGTLDQAARTARMPFVPGKLALMPDAHIGFGSTVGSVFPTKGAIIPSAIGVDIGCGMVASLTNLTLNDLPEDLGRLMPLVEQRIPAGVGKGHQPNVALDLLDRYNVRLDFPPGTPVTAKQTETFICQYGSLGTGNHFGEVCADELERIWTVLHSGSRGIGKQLATHHINEAKGLMKKYFIRLEDPDLAYLVEGSPEFEAYIKDMLWAQDYAFGSRALMNKQFNASLFEVVGHGSVIDTINCHHNFTQKEHHLGTDVWITRKGAIKADVTDWGIIPGSMGTDTHIVKGLGNPASYNSCSHGAGRKMSRTAAKRNLTVSTLRTYMEGQTWNQDAAAELVDEHPDAYKDISQVMRDQTDLCRSMHRLVSVFNYKGTK